MKIKNLLYKIGLLDPGPGIERRKSLRNTKGNLLDVLSDKETHKEEKNIHGLSNEEVIAILEDMLLYNRITDGSFLYEWNNHDAQGVDNGSTKFSAIAHSPLYNKNINQNEEVLYEDPELDAMVAYISKKKTTHIELGPESGEKFIKYSDQWDPDYWHLKGKKYIGVDVSGVYVDMANKNVKKIGMVAESVPGDRFEHSVFDTERNQIYYFYGGSICNLDVGYRQDPKYPDKKKTIINLLRRMRSNQSLSSVPIVLTYFEAPDKNNPEYKDNVDKLKATYGSKESGKYYNEETHTAVSDFILSGLEALGIERSKLEFLVEYDDTYSPAMIKLGAKFIEKTEIQIGKNKIVKEAGEKIRAIKSHRFTKEEFKEIAKDADLGITYEKSRGGVAVAVLQSKLGINDKFKKTRNIFYGTLIGASLLGGGLLTKNILHQKEITQEKEKMDTKFVSNQKMFFYSGGGHGYYELKTDAEKIEYINELTNAVFENITVRYNIQTDEEEIKKIIRSYVKDKNILGKFSNTDDYIDNIFNISDDFVKKYSDILVEKDINSMPYDHLKQYEEYFKDIIVDINMMNERMTRLSGTQGTMDVSNSYIPDPSNGQLPHYSTIDLECVKSGTKSSFKEEKSIRVEEEDDPRIIRFLSGRTDIKSHYVKDGYLYIKVWKEQPYSYIRVANIHGDKEKKNIDMTIIAYDYFYQNRPIIHEAYEKFGAIYWNMSGNSNREKDQTYRWKKDSIKMLITKDLLQTGFLDKIPADNDSAILVYLQGFVQRNAKSIQKEGASIVPYETYGKIYGEAFENTHNIPQENKLPTVITYEDRKTYDFHYIGKYYTQKGTEYDIAEMIIVGKKYLYARNISEDKDQYHTEEGINITLLNYYLMRGKEVTKDNMNLKKLTNQSSDSLARNINTPYRNQKSLTFKNIQPDTKPKGFNPGTNKNK
ncbi:MAG: L-histidine N(alpha)-methyltransferase [candidate division SR1 bacterium]|nr:L-histidine N(alpha)-methyltransferase [candidate division SR1 bacterium]